MEAIVKWIFVSIVSLGIILAAKHGTNIDEKKKVKIIIESADTTIYAIPGDTVIVQANKYINISPGDSILIISGDDVKKIIIEDSIEIRLLKSPRRQEFKSSRKQEEKDDAVK